MKIAEAKDKFGVGTQVRYFEDPREPHHTVTEVVLPPARIGCRVCVFLRHHSHAIDVRNLELIGEGVAA